MPKNDNITIDEFQLGIGPSPHVGFGDMRNLDIYTKPGVIRINNQLDKKSASTVTNLPLWIKRNPANTDQVFALDGAGKLYKSTDSGTTWAATAAAGAVGFGQGLEIIGAYVIVARSTKLDVYSIVGDSWTNDWQTIDSDGAWHPMIHSKNDGKIYGGAGQYVFSIEIVGAFVPGTSSTYVFTQQALDLPNNYRIKSLCELGEKLMIGTWMGSNIYEFKIADIFRWDRSSPSFETPISLNTNGVNAMITKNNIMIVLAGVDGQIYACNGVQASPIAKIPISVSNIEGGYHLTPYPGAIMDYKERIFFGVSSSNSVGGCGIWSLLQTSQGNILNFEHQISTGNDGTSNALLIGSLLPITRDVFLAGWRDNTTYGIDMTNNVVRYASYAAYFESAFYNIGTNLRKRTLQQLEFLLVRALASGHGVKIKYRNKLSDSFTTIGTYDFTGLGAVMSHNVVADIPEAEFVQIRCELTTGASSATTPELRTVLSK